MTVYLTVLSVATAFAMTTACGADVEVVKVGSPGTLTNIVTDFVSGAWEVSFTAAGEPSVTIRVQADEEEPIRFIRVEANRTTGFSTGDVQLVVDAKVGTSGRVVRVEEIEPTSNDGTADAELFVSTVRIRKTSGGAEGNIGRPGTTLGGFVRAHAINTLD